MTTKNPFPGMNPFFEQRWRDAHSRLITYLCDALQERLPPDLIAGAEEEAAAVATGEPAAAFRPDVQVRQPWMLKEPGRVALIENPEVTATEPMRFFVEEEIERWIEIRDQTGRLITVIELLSPTNKKEGPGRNQYLNKRQGFMNARVNVVEIDLVREGEPVFPACIRNALKQAGACYGVCVFRATQPNEREVYPIRLADRLPVIRVPLCPADTDVVLALQPLIDQCHERGRYHLLNYRLPLHPPLSPDEAEWVNKILREQEIQQEP